MKFRREYRDPRPGEVAAFLSTHADWVRGQGNLTGKGDELRFRRCPKCGHNKQENPACQINIQTGLWRCFACNGVGNWFTLTREFGSPIPESDRYKDGPGVIHPHHFDQLRGKKRRPVTENHHPELLEYCHNRGIDDATLNTWRVSTRGKHSLRWPIYAWCNDTWEIVNSRIRVCTDPKATTRDYFEIRGGATGLLIGNHTLDVSGPKRAIIFEGQWDAMTAWHLGLRNVFSLPNGAGNVRVADMLRYIPDDWEIWLAMDNDDAGQRAVEKFFAQLGPDRIARLRFPAKDLNDWLVERDGLLRASEVEACAQGMTTMVALQSANDESFMAMDMDDLESKKTEPVAYAPWTKFNHLFAGGFRPGETTGVLAPSGVGKTTWCNNVAVHNAVNGVKVGLVSLEGTRDALKRKLKDPIRGIAKPEQYQSTLQNLMVSNLEGTQVTWQQCVLEFESMIDRGAKFLILDNLDFITRDSSSEKSAAYGAMIDLATTRAVHIIVVWQPNKVDRSQIVNSGNQKGYSQTFQDADNYINLNLVDDFVRIEIEKTREEGVERLDNKSWYVYHKKTRIFEELSDDVRVTASGNRGKIISFDAAHG